MTIEPIEKGLIGPGSRLCLSGLNASATANVRQILIELGAEGTSFRSGADGIILPDTVSDTERAEAISQGYAVFSVSELTRLARGAEEERPALEIGKKTIRIRSARYIA